MTFAYECSVRVCNVATLQQAPWEPEHALEHKSEERQAEKWLAWDDFPHCLIIVRVWV
jgi:hypothetical protein